MKKAVKKEEIKRAHFYTNQRQGAVYHSKVVIICWAVIYVAAITAATLKQRWAGLRHILVGAGIVAAGTTASALFNNAAGALLLSAALLVSTYFALTGIIKTFSKD